MPVEKDQIAVMLSEKVSVGSKCNVTFGAYTGLLNDFKTASFFRTSYQATDGQTKLAGHVRVFGTNCVRLQVDCCIALRRGRHVSVSYTQLRRTYVQVNLLHYHGASQGSAGIVEWNGDWNCGHRVCAWCIFAPFAFQCSDGWAKTTFEPVKPMSAYLIAFAVGDFTGIQRRNKHGTLVRAWAWRGVEPYLDTALDVGVRTLEWFGDYFDFPFPLAKQGGCGNCFCFMHGLQICWHCRSSV
jgi:hypothetical protein